MLAGWLFGFVEQEEMKTGGWDYLKRLKLTTSRKRLHSLINDLNLRIIAEVGVHRGQFFKYLLRTQPTLLVGVDLWNASGPASQNDQRDTQLEMDHYHRDLQELSTQNPNTRIIRDLSDKAAAVFPDNFFDLVYIDADHTYDAVQADLKAWWPKVKVSGVLAGHDYENWVTDQYVRFGVVKAVDEFVATQKLQHRFHVTQDSPRSWLILKN